MSESSNKKRNEKYHKTDEDDKVLNVIKFNEEIFPLSSLQRSNKNWNTQKMILESKLQREHFQRNKKKKIVELKIIVKINLMKIPLLSRIITPDITRKNIFNPFS